MPGEVAGKSGTAEYGGGDPPPTHAWFIAFRGDLAIAVLVENGRSGGSVAAPIAERFFDALGPRSGELRVRGVRSGLLRCARNCITEGRRRPAAGAAPRRLGALTRSRADGRRRRPSVGCLPAAPRSWRRPTFGGPAARCALAIPR